jgi:hypothetical protein
MMKTLYSLHDLCSSHCLTIGTITLVLYQDLDQKVKLLAFDQILHYHIIES